MSKSDKPIVGNVIRMNSLADRLKALGVKTGVEVQAPTPKNKYSTLEKQISGEVVSTSLGDCVLKKHFYPNGYQHGCVKIGEGISSDAIQRATKMSGENIPLKNLLFIDTETSGLSGGTGTFAFLVGIGRFTDQGFLLEQLVMRDPIEESALLLYFLSRVEPDTVFVSFNGKSFDIPILSSRLVLNRMKADLRVKPHLDILHLSRKLWKHQLQSCSLKEIETQVLKIERTEDDVPGWMIPDIYFEFLHSGNPKRLEQVIYHNAVDIVSLAALFIHISTLLTENVTEKHVSLTELVAIGKVFHETGEIEISRTIFENSLNKSLTVANRLYVHATLAGDYKQKRDYEHATAHWEKAAGLCSFEACVELAKYHEHQIKDIKKAMYWANCGKKIIETQDTSRYHARVLVEVTHRISRLESKARKNV